MQTTQPTTTMGIWPMLERVATWLAGLLLAWWALVALVWVIGLQLIVPRLDDWRGPLQSMASWALGVPVQVQRVAVHTDAVLPELVLQQVVLGQGEQAPRAAEVRVTASWWSLLKLELASVEVLAPEVTLAKDAQGWSVVGLDGAPSASADSPWLAWVLARPLVAVQDGVLRWRVPATPGQAPEQGQFDALNLRLSQQGRRVALSVQAHPAGRPQTPWQVQLDARVPLWPSDATQWQAWTAQLYWQVQGLDWSRWRNHLGAWAQDPRLPSQGVGNGRGWADWRDGRWQQITTDVAMRNLRFVPADATEPLWLPTLQTRLTWQGQALGGWQLRSQGLLFTWGAQQRWPGGDVAVDWQPANGQTPAQLELSGQQLELGAMLALAKPLGLTQALPSMWREAGLSGLLPDLRLRWQGASVGAADWQLQAAFEQLAWRANAQPWRPGMTGATGRLEASAQRVVLNLETRQATLALPGVWPNAQTFDELQGELVWQPAPNGRWQVQTSGLRWASAGGQGTWVGRWTGLPGEFGEVDLTLRDGGLNWPQFQAWLPQTWEPAQPLAGLSGRLTDVQMTLKGALPEILNLHAAAPANMGWRGQATLQALTWPGSDGAGPGMAGVGGELRWQPQRVSLTRATGRLADAAQAQLTQADITWDASTDQPQVTVALQASGPLQAWLRVARRAAPKHGLGATLANVNATGQVRANLQGTGPWQGLAQLPWRGEIRLEDANVAWQPGLPPLQKLNGQLLWDGATWRARDMRAQWLGGPIQGDLSYATSGAWRVQLQGAANLDRLRAVQAFAPAQGVLAQMRGTLPFELLWDHTAAQASWRLTSSLQGVALALPAPFNKDEASRWPLELQVSSSQDQPERSQVELRLDAPAAPVAARVQVQRRGSAWQPVAGAWAVGAPLPQDPPSDQAVNGVVRLPELSVDAWRAWMVRGVLQDTLGNEWGQASAWWPARWQVDVDRLLIEDATLTALNAQAERAGQGWRGQIDADQVKGKWRWQPTEAGQAPKLRGTFDRLWLPKPRAGGQGWSQQLRDNLPDADVVVKSLRIGARDWGRLELVAKPLAQPTRRWQISKLVLQTPDASLQANGYWQIPVAQSPAATTQPQRTQLRFELGITNAGELLARFDMPGVLRDGTGNMQGELSWDDSPFDLQPSSLSGDLELNLARGQFLRADPGIAKLLGVLSLQTLPRRLLLDFRDVFAQGFAFDQARGKARVAQGVIRTNSLTMQGVSASVLMEGELDVVRETQRLRVLVSPDLDTTAVSLLTATASPVVGLVSLLLQRSVGSVLNAQGMRAFEVSGSWDDPKVQNVALQRGDGKAPVEVLQPQTVAPKAQ